MGGREALHDRKPYRERNWNQLLPEERAKVLDVALLYPEWSSREIGCHIADLRLHRLRVHGVSAAQAGGLDQAEGYPALPGELGIPGEDEAARPDVADGRDVSVGEELGLVLPDLDPGRLQPQDPGVEAPNAMDADAFSEVVELACEATGMDPVL